MPPSRESLLQLITALRSPTQQQQEVMSILKNNPSLMTAFIKQRQQALQQQQGQGGQLIGPGGQQQPGMQVQPQGQGQLMPRFAQQAYNQSQNYHRYQPY